MGKAWSRTSAPALVAPEEVMDSESKHTELTVEDRIERLVIWSGIEGRPEVASLGTDSGEVDDDKQKAFEREQQAYAALFAAAPDMKAALKAVLEAFHTGSDSENARALMDAELALAKASGR